MRDLFQRIVENKGPLGKWASIAEGYFVFPKLEGPISNRMKFNGKDVLNARIVDGPAGKQTGLNRLGRGKTKPTYTL